MTESRYADPVGQITPQGSLFLASCLACTWKLRRRQLDDAISLVRSHCRIAHGGPETITVYLED